LSARLGYLDAGASPPASPETQNHELSKFIVLTRDGWPRAAGFVHPRFNVPTPLAARRIAKWRRTQCKPGLRSRSKSDRRGRAEQRSAWGSTSIAEYACDNRYSCGLRTSAASETAFAGWPGCRPCGSDELWSLLEDKSICSRHRQFSYSNRHRHGTLSAGQDFRPRGRPRMKAALET
jgi:hypothetical protein